MDTTLSVQPAIMAQKKIVKTGGQIQKDIIVKRWIIAADEIQADCTGEGVAKKCKPPSTDIARWLQIDRDIAKEASHPLVEIFVCKAPSEDLLHAYV